MSKPLTLSESAQLQKEHFPGIFRQLTQSLTGETCTQVHFSYGDELCLDFGNLSPYQYSNMPELLEGKWILSARATPWKLYRDDNLIANSEMPTTEQEIEQAKTITRDNIQGKKLLGFSIDAERLTTTLNFEGSYSLILYPDLKEQELQHWVLSMPSDQVLTIGPGYNWSCKSIYDRY